MAFLVLNPQFTAKLHAFYISNRHISVESILNYKNGFINNLMHKETFHETFFENSNRHMNEGLTLLIAISENR
jgi:hypothetical protein